MTGVEMPRIAAILAAFAPVSAGQASKPAVRVDAIDGIAEAFRTHRVVMLPGGHGSRQALDLLLAIVREPRIQGTVTDIVVEFGSSRYQDLIDRFVRGTSFRSCNYDCAPSSNGHWRAQRASRRTAAGGARNPDEVNQFKTDSEYAEDVEIATMHRVLETLRAAVNWGNDDKPFREADCGWSLVQETARTRQLRSPAPRLE